LYHQNLPSDVHIATACKWQAEQCG